MRECWLGTAPAPQLLNSNPEIASSNPYATEGNLPTTPLLKPSASLHLQYDLGGAVLHSISAFRKVSARSVEISYAEVPSFTEAKQLTQESRSMVPR